MAWLNLDEELAEEFAPFVQRTHEIEEALERWKSHLLSPMQERLLSGCCAVCDEKRAPKSRWFCPEHLERARHHATRRARKRGMHAWVDPSPVRAHVAALVAAGIPRYLIARAAGVSRSVLSLLPKRKRLHPRTAERILAVELPVAKGAVRLVDAGPAREHLDRLAKEGVRVATVARIVELDQQRIYAIANGEVIKARPEAVQRILAVTAAAASGIQVHGGGRPVARDPNRFVHGTLARYGIGCRCDLCRGARRLYDKQRGARHPAPSLPVAAE